MEDNMRPALAIVNKSRGKPPAAGLRKFTDTMGFQRYKDSFMLSVSNTAKLEAENKSWISAVRENFATQLSILLKPDETS